MSKLLWVLYFLCLTGGLLQNFAQLLHKVADHDGFGQKAIHAAFQGIAAVFVECVGGHGKDRDLCQCGVVQCADLPGGGTPEWSGRPPAAVPVLRFLRRSRSAGKPPSPMPQAGK